MQDLIFSSIPLEQLKTELRETLKKELQFYLQVIRPQKAPEEYLSRKQAASLLRISLPTLNEWTKSGIIQGYRISSRIRYKRNELDASLLKIKTRRA